MPVTKTWAFVYLTVMGALAVTIKKNLLLAGFLLLILCLSLGCGVTAKNQLTAPDVPRGKGIIFTVKDKPYLKVWQAAIRAMTSELNLTSVDMQKGELIGGRPRWDSDEGVGLFITPARDAESYIVEITSSRDDPMLKDWQVLISEKMQKILNRGYSGLKSKEDEK